MTFCWRKDYQTLISLKKFESPCDNVQKDIFLYGDSRLDRRKNEVVFVTTLTYIKNSEIFSGSPLEEIFLNE